MRFKCPHCDIAKDYTEEEFKSFFIRCKNCEKEFRAAEASPLTGSASDQITGSTLRQKIQDSFGELPESKPSRSPSGKKKPSIARLNAQAAAQMERGELEQAEAGLKESLRQNPDQPLVQRLLRKIDGMRRNP